jgi:hypothetical protein
MPARFGSDRSLVEYTFSFSPALISQEAFGSSDPHRRCLHSSRIQQLEGWLGATAAPAAALPSGNVPREQPESYCQKLGVNDRILAS